MVARPTLVVNWCKSTFRPFIERLQLITSMKFFMHPDLDDFRKSELLPRFSKVVVDKPKESRKGTSLSRMGETS
jgi:hypothetical protein